MTSVLRRASLVTPLLGLAACSIGPPDEPEGALAAAPGALVSAPGALPTCVVLERGGPGDIADAEINAKQPNKNSGTDNINRTGNTAGMQRHTLLRVDTSPIPPYATVESATLALWQSNDGAAALRLHRANAAWDEAKVTWNNFAGAFDPVVLASASNGGANHTGPIFFDVGAIAQQWISHQSPNHGLLIEQKGEGTTQIRAAEHGSAKFRPRLQVCYTTPDLEPDVPEGTSVFLRVMDVNGAPIPSAAVTPAGTSSPLPTNGVGYLLLDNLAAGRFSARVERPGYAPAAVAVDVPNGVHGGVEVRLHPLPPPIPFDAAVGAALDVGNVHVTIPSNALVDRNGEPVSGTVTATIVPLDPSAGLTTMPGPLEALTGSGDLVSLESFGMAEVTIWQNGLPLQLAPGKKAMLEIVLSPTLASKVTLGDTMPAWWLDLDDGIWREDGAGVFQSSLVEVGKTAWKAEVEHFTWWNADRPWTDKNCFILPVQEDSGVGIPGVPVQAYGVSYAGASTPQVTDGSGYACVDIMLGGTANLYVGNPLSPFTVVPVTGSGPAGDCAGNGAGCTVLATTLIPFTNICLGDVQSTTCAYTGLLGTEGVGACHAGTRTCDWTGTGWMPCAGEVTPTPELCATPIDDDCDGLTNEEGDDCTCTPGETVFCYAGPPGTLGVGVCQSGMRTCAADGLGYGPCVGQVLPAPEDCSTASIDENCDGTPTCACMDGVPGKVACWPFDENTGPTSVDEIGGFNGIWANGPTPVPGVFAGALSFDGINDSVSVPSDPGLNFGAGDFSFSFYIRTVAGGVILDKRVEVSGPVRGFVISSFPDGLIFQLADGGWANYYTGVHVSDDQWHHVVVTVDRDQPDGIKVYRDKVLMSTHNPLSRPGNISNDIPLAFGRRSDAPGWPGYFQGSLDAVKLFNRALTAAEVMVL
ncbi:DNRLRE domain-containing protein [Polyangium mundeleinium]|uniref:DNRLRE domain-containing protein n=1 Tax=Polyangium mundeleinium TaxID=2995306 RepID=A0ABT5EJT1_9BACT|nr:DNRLRE domain-containing protein [Polyangium mundeleinium]MDC0741592.1 DNRLRE domain-containing protein [Polyangium mundeleinium]